MGLQILSFSSCLSRVHIYSSADMTKLFTLNPREVAPTHYLYEVCGVFHDPMEKNPFLSTYE